jgi:hypothetical protein
VPMIIRHPAMKQSGLQDHQVVELVDLFPTLADLSGASFDKYNIPIHIPISIVYVHSFIVHPSIFKNPCIKNFAQKKKINHISPWYPHTYIAYSALPSNLDGQSLASVVLTPLLANSLLKRFAIAQFSPFVEFNKCMAYAIIGKIIIHNK